MAVANGSYMKVAIAQCPILSDVEAQPRQQAQSMSREAASAKTDSPAAQLAAKVIVIVSGAAMMFCLINYGRIFENYLQW